MLTVRMIALLAVAACSRYAYAQAIPAASGPGSYVAVGVGFSSYQADYGQRWIDGGVAFVDVHPTWRYGIEGEARMLKYHIAEGVKESTYLAGPIVYLRPRSFRPYAKFLIGEGKIDLPFGYGHGSFLAYAPGVGIDYLLSDRISIRAIDLEYQQWPQFKFGALHPYGVSAAIVIRLNKVSRYPR
jgi:Outer membrane protein beta-barrel domain